VVSVRASGPLVAVVDGNRPPFTLRFVTTDGREALSYAVPTGYTPINAGGDYALLRSDQGQVTAVSRDGHLYDLGTSPATTSTGPLISPDGKLWLTTASNWDQASGIIHSTVYLGPLGREGSLVARADQQQRDLRPVTWTPMGPTVEHGAVGIGGYYVFYNTSGAVDRIDTTSGTAVALSYDAGSCGFTDLDKDGRIACVTFDSTALRIYNQGQVKTISLPQPRFKAAGNAYFNPGSSPQLVIGGSQRLGPPQERFETDLVNLNDGTLKPVGPPNSRPAPGPWAWLRDGSLILAVPDYSAGPNPGTYILRPDNSWTKISTGQPFGLLPG
jgi:hypothetical protein